MRAEHLKRRGDEALKAGDLRGAGEFYAQCLAVRPERAGAEAVLGNRSLALARARRFAEALRDADAAVRLKPGWAKVSPPRRDVRRRRSRRIASGLPDPPPPFRGTGGGRPRCGA